MNAFPSLKTALVHHWLVKMRGGERVFEALAEMLPHADLMTLVCDHSRVEPAFGNRHIHTSFLQYLPRPTRWYPFYLPLYPMATERLDLSGYEVVITSDAATLKGVRTDPGAVHICYCHTPMRYIWSGYETYYRAFGPVTRLVYPSVTRWLREWDWRAAQGVTHFVANSHNVAERIQRYYERESTVIYPPVDTEFFVPAAADPQDYFLVASPLVPYKRVDLAVEAFNQNGKRLLVVGDGSERSRLEKRARSNITFLGFQPAPVLRKIMQACRALVFPGEEDFGIVMAEAQACGRPVLAFGRGGACEIVEDGATGMLFREQSAEALADAVETFEARRFDPPLIRTLACRFNRKRFLREFAEFVRCRVYGFRFHVASARRDKG